MLGGFHLAPHKEEYVKETVMALKEISPDFIASPCTAPVNDSMGSPKLNTGRLLRAYTGLICI